MYARLLIFGEICNIQSLSEYSGPSAKIFHEKTELSFIKQISTTIPPVFQLLVLQFLWCKGHGETMLPVYKPLVNHG